MATIGFIGLGIMGAHMARNLKNAGHALVLNGAYPIPDDLRSQGQIVDDSRDVARASEIVIVMVPDTPDVENVLFANDGVAKGLERGKLVIDMSSISPIDTQAFAKKINALGCDYLDAPVSGGEVGAREASLTIMVGGPEAAFERAKPLFNVMGKNVSLIGENRRGANVQGREPDHRGVEHRSGRGSAAVCIAFRRGSRTRPARADGRFRVIARAGSARRTHDETHVRPGFSYRIASEGFESRAGKRTQARRRVAQHGERAATVQRVRGERRTRVGSLGDGARARNHVESPGRQLGLEQAGSVERRPGLDVEALVGQTSCPGVRLPDCERCLL